MIYKEATGYKVVSRLALASRVVSGKDLEAGRTALAVISSWFHGFTGAGRRGRGCRLVEIKRWPGVSNTANENSREIAWLDSG